MLKRRFDNKRQPHKCNPDSDKNRDQKLHALLKLIKQMGDTVNHPVINSHGNRHRSPADTGDDVRHTHYHTF